MGLLSKIKNVFKKDQSPKQQASRPEYSEIIPTLKIRDDRFLEVKLICDKFKTLKPRYDIVSEKTGVPSDLIFALHYREASLRFNGVLHNGENILGTGHKTRLEPKGRGPFETWEEAAIDALLIKKNIFPQSWTLESKLTFAERFNGLGYKYKGLPSPYVLSFTNGYSKGKYVADGKFDANFIDKQCGVAAILIGLQNGNV